MPGLRVDAEILRDDDRRNGSTNNGMMINIAFENLRKKTQLSFLR